MTVSSVKGTPSGSSDISRRNITFSSSSRVMELLGEGPQTSNYLNKQDLVIADNGLLMIFGGIADRVNGCIRRGTTEVIPTASYKTIIEDGLNEDLVKGHEGNIHHLKMNPETFKHLFIEGVITQDVLKKAIVTERMVILQKLSFVTAFGTLELPVLVSPDYEFDVVSVDISGNIIR